MSSTTSKTSTISTITFLEFNKNPSMCSAWLKKQKRCCRNIIADESCKRRTILLRKAKSSSHPALSKEETTELINLLFCKNKHRYGKNSISDPAELLLVLEALIPSISSEQSTPNTAQPPAAGHDPRPGTSMYSQSSSSSRNKGRHAALRASQIRSINKLSTTTLDALYAGRSRRTYDIQTTDSQQNSHPIQAPLGEIQDSRPLNTHPTASENLPFTWNTTAGTEPRGQQSRNPGSPPPTPISIAETLFTNSNISFRQSPPSSMPPSEPLIIDPAYTSGLTWGNPEPDSIIPEQTTSFYDLGHGQGSLKGCSIDFTELASSLTSKTSSKPAPPTSLPTQVPMTAQLPSTSDQGLRRSARIQGLGSKASSMLTPQAILPVQAPITVVGQPQGWPRISSIQGLGSDTSPNRSLPLLLPGRTPMAPPKAAAQSQGVRRSARIQTQLSSVSPMTSFSATLSAQASMTPLPVTQSERLRRSGRNTSPATPLPVVLPIQVLSTTPAALAQPPGRRRSARIQALSVISPSG
jgi:hypothetical protein